MSTDATTQGHAGNVGGADSGKAIDPVCGMTVTMEGAKHVATYEGKTYFFAAMAASPNLWLPRPPI